MKPKEKAKCSFDEYKWKFFDRQRDYKWSRKTDGYVYSLEEVYSEWLYLQEVKQEIEKL